MIFAFVLLIVFALVLFLLVKTYKFNSKAAIALVVAATFVFTSGVCIFQPKMHKPFSIDIIEYFIKINDDGSMTTTKQVTRTVIKDKQQPQETEK